MLQTSFYSKHKIAFKTLCKVKDCSLLRFCCFHSGMVMIKNLIGGIHLVKNKLCTFSRCQQGWYAFASQCCHCQSKWLCKVNLCSMQ